MWYDGSGGSLIATVVGSGAGAPIFNGGLRAVFAPGAGAGGGSVLASASCGDFQPTASLAAWVAGAIRSDAGTIFVALSTAAAGGAWTDAAWPCAAGASATGGALDGAF